MNWKEMTYFRSALLALALADVGLAQGTFIEYPAPGVNFQHIVNSVTAGPDGNLWFTEAEAGRIGRITPAGVITEFPVPTTGSSPFGITAGADGNLWFTEANGGALGGLIGRITPGGVVTEFPIPTLFSGPFGIAAGPDGNLWFVEFSSNKIGRITTTGVVTEFPIPTALSGSFGITAGPDGNLWFTEADGIKIGRITLAGSITEFIIPTASSRPFGITSGPDGNVWFTEFNGNQIGRITPTGNITEFPVHTIGGSPTGITVGSDGNLWFTEINGSQIGRISPSGDVMEFPVPTLNGDPSWITLGPDGNLWFRQELPNKIVKLLFPDPTDAFQVRYASNLNIGDAVINLTNSGASSTAAFSPQNGNLCVNAYTYSPDEQLVSCCSCLVTPNGLASLSVNDDLLSDTLTPIRPNAVVVKLLATTGAATAGTCDAATVSRGGTNRLASGMVALGTTLHALPVTAGTPAGTYGMTESRFVKSMLSAAELSRMTQMCSFIKANGSGYGICKSCKVGGLGAARK